MAVAFVAVICVSSFAAQAEELSADPKSLNRLIVVPGTDVVIVGEVHDNPIHHLNQARVVLDVDPKAIVFEMLSDSQALTIRPDMLQDKKTLALTLDWAESGWPSFEMYYPIFAAADDALIFGGALSRDLVRQAVSDGAAKVFGPGAKIFGLDRPLDDDVQSAREKGQMTAHCDALPTSILNGMVEAQRLRDAALARAVIAAYAETGGPVVAIVGNGHARFDWGIPAALAIAAPNLDVWTIGQFESLPDQNETVPFDSWILTDHVDRDDPCLAFKSK